MSTCEGPLGAAKRLWPEQDAAGFVYFDYLHACGSPRQSLFYAGLFWPRFIEFDGMVFMEATIEGDSDHQIILDALRKFDGDRTKTEQSLNRWELAHMFQPMFRDTSEAEELALARLISEMWLARLRMLFPSRRFIVEVRPMEDWADSVSVLFYQAR